MKKKIDCQRHKPLISRQPLQPGPPLQACQCLCCPSQVLDNFSWRGLSWLVRTCTPSRVPLILHTGSPRVLPNILIPKPHPRPVKSELPRVVSGFSIFYDSQEMLMRHRRGGRLLCSEGICISPLSAAITKHLRLGTL